jgi:hypothetical protein
MVRSFPLNLTERVRVLTVPTTFAIVAIVFLINIRKEAVTFMQKIERIVTNDGCFDLPPEGSL